MTIVDAHAHVFRPAHVAARTADELAPADRDASVETLMAAMDDAGVAQAVLVPLGHEDDVVAAALLSHPRRFAAIAIAGAAEHGTDARADSASAVARRLEATGFHGLRTSWLGPPGRPLRDSPMLPGLRELARRGAALWTYLPPDQAPLLEDLASLVPELPVVLNHLGFAPFDMRVDAHGRPWFQTRLPPERVASVRALARHANVHLMVSGLYALSHEPAPYAEVADAVGELCEAFGSRVLWGSDFPWIASVPGYRETLATTRPLVPPSLHDDLLGATARRLFGHLRTEGATDAAHR